MTSLLKVVSTTNSRQKNKSRSNRSRRGDKNGASPTSSRGTVSRTPHSPLAPTNLSLASGIDKSTSKEVVRGSLKSTPHYTSTVTLADKIGSLFASDFRFSDKEAETLTEQFTTFFEMLGWTNKDNMVDMAEAPFPRPEELGAKPEPVTMISPAMIIYSQAL